MATLRLNEFQIESLRNTFNIMAKHAYSQNDSFMLDGKTIQDIDYMEQRHHEKAMEEIVSMLSKDVVCIDGDDLRKLKFYLNAYVTHYHDEDYKNAMISNPNITKISSGFGAYFHGEQGGIITFLSFMLFWSVVINFFALR